MQYLEFTSINPTFNLALEEAIFEALVPDHPGYFLLWQNAPSVIIGRHQITHEVVNSLLVEKYATPVIRRNSGGGAVYHDGGNLNFSFIQNIPSSFKPNLSHYMQKIALTLSQFGFFSTINSRNDLEYRGRKFSGNSQMICNGKLLHHGTLLVQSDIERMGEILRVDSIKSRSHGVQSVGARVINLAQIAPIDLADLKKALAQSCSQDKGVIPQDTLVRATQLAKTKYATWEWNYGKSPASDRLWRKRLSCGELIIGLVMKGDVIKKCHIQGDFINIRDVAELEDFFTGCKFHPDAMRHVIKKIDWKYYLVNSEKSELTHFFCVDIFE